MPSTTEQPSLPFAATYMVELISQSSLDAIRRWIEKPQTRAALRAIKHDLIDCKGHYANLKQLLSANPESWTRIQEQLVKQSSASLTNTDDTTAEIERRIVAFAERVVAAGPIPGKLNSSISLKQQGYCMRAALGLFFTAFRNLQEQPRNGCFACKLGGRPTKQWKPFTRLPEDDAPAHGPQRRTRRGHRGGRRYARARRNRDMAAEIEDMHFAEHVEAEDDELVSPRSPVSIPDDELPSSSCLGFEEGVTEEEGTNPETQAYEDATSAEAAPNVCRPEVLQNPAGADHDYDYSRRDDGEGGQLSRSPPPPYYLPPNVGRARPLYWTQEQEDRVRAELKEEMRVKLQEELLEEV